MKAVALFLSFALIQLAEHVECSAVPAAHQNSRTAAQSNALKNGGPLKNGFDVQSDGYELVMHGVIHDDVELVDKLVSMGVRLDRVFDGENRTLLHVAAEKGSTRLTRWLIEDKDFKFNVLDSNGMTPLHYAAENDQLSEAKLLVDLAINSRSKNKKTPLGIAKNKVKAYLMEIGGTE